MSETDGIYAAMSGAIAQQQAMESLSDNLANIGTVGFKGSRISFQDMVSTLTPHTRVAQVTPDLSQGAMRSTGNPLDVALGGPGFFAVNTADGERYTRQGTFRLRADGVLENQDGLPVQAEGGGDIRLPPNSAPHIDHMGTVFANDAAVARLRIVNVEDLASLRREAHGLWGAGNTVPAESNYPNTRVESGMLEQSNVNAVHTMTGVIAAQRAYESYHRAMEMIQSMQQKLTNDVG